MDEIDASQLTEERPVENTDAAAKGDPGGDRLRHG